MVLMIMALGWLTCEFVCEMCLWGRLFPFVQHFTALWFMRYDCGVRHVGTSHNIWHCSERVRWSHRHPQHQHQHRGRWSAAWRILLQSWQRRWNRCACRRCTQQHEWLRRAEPGCKSPWPRRRHGTPTGSWRHQCVDRERRSWICNAQAPAQRKHTFNRSLTPLS